MYKDNISDHKELLILTLFDKLGYRAAFEKEVYFSSEKMSALKN